MSEQFLRDIGSELKILIAQLSDALGVAAGFVFETMIRQQIANGVTHVILAVLVVFVGWKTAKTYIRHVMIPAKMQKHERYGESIGDYKFPVWHITNNDAVVGLGVLTGAIILASVILFFVFGLWGIRELINPQYYALKEIVDLIHGPAPIINK